MKRPLKIIAVIALFVVIMIYAFPPIVKFLNGIG